MIAFENDNILERYEFFERYGNHVKNGQKKKKKPLYLSKLP